MKMICDVPDEVIKSVRMGTWCGSSVTEKMIAKGIPLEQEPCEDCISRETTLKILCEKCPVYDCVTVCQSYKSIEKMPPVTPTIPDVENNYNIGYNCGYADAMSDVADMRGDADEKH